MTSAKLSIKDLLRVQEAQLIRILEMSTSEIDSLLSEIFIKRELETPFGTITLYKRRTFSKLEENYVQVTSRQRKNDQPR